MNEEQAGVMSAITSAGRQARTEEESHQQPAASGEIAHMGVQPLPQLCAAAAGAIAVLALAGWGLGERFLAGESAANIPMAPSSALAIGLLGATLFCCARWPAQRPSRLFALAATSFVFLLSLLVLLQSITGIDMDVEQALSRTNEVFGSVPLGRMSPLSAIVILLESAALSSLLVAHRWQRAPTAAALLSGSAITITGVVLTGYVYGTPLLYGGAVIPVALPTAVALFLVGIGQINLALPAIPELSAWGSASLRGRLLRAFLPTMLFLILANGWVNSGLGPFRQFNPALLQSLTALASSAVIMIVVWWLAQRTADAIEQAHEQIRSLARFPDEDINPVLRFGRDGSLLYANRSSQFLLEAWQRQQPGRSLPDAERRLIAETLESGVSHGGEAKCDKMTYWLTFVPIPEMDYVNIYGHDITQRKQAEEMQRKSEEQFRAVAETANDAILSVNSQGNIVFWNRAAERMFGYLAEDVTGKLLSLIIPERLRTEHDSRLQGMAMREGPPIIGTVTEVTGVRRDGSEFAVELSLATSSFGQNTQFTAICRDISERRRAEEALRESEQRFRTLFDGVPIGLYRTSPQGEILDANPALAQMLGYPDRAALRATNAADLYLDSQERSRELSELEHEAMVHDHEMEMLRLDGSVIWVQDRARAVCDPEGKVLYYEGSLRDISEHKQAEEMLRSQSLNDDLTGLYNRRGFLALADQQMKLARRKKSDTTLLFFADLDGMKWINDTFGHQEGDRALIAAAGIFKNTFRESDIVARMSGDEFVVLALETTGDDGSPLSTRLQDALNAHNAQTDRGYTLSLSVGVARYDPEHPCSVQELLARADSLMYQNKRGKHS